MTACNSRVNILKPLKSNLMAWLLVLPGLCKVAESDCICCHLIVIDYCEYSGIWKRELSCSGPATPNLHTAAWPTDHDRLIHRQQQPGLRLFIRLEAGAPARAYSSHTI
jgi:hypothetical protein